MNRRELERLFAPTEEKKYKTIEKLKGRIDKRFDELLNEFLMLLTLYNNEDILNRLTGANLKAYRSRINKYIEEDNTHNNYFDKDIKQALKGALTRRTTIEQAIALEVKALLNIAYHKLENDFDETLDNVYADSYSDNFEKTKKVTDNKKSSKEHDPDLESTWRPNELNHRDLLWGDMRQLMVQIPKIIRYAKFRNEDNDTILNDIESKLRVKNRRAKTNIATDAEYFFILGQVDAFKDNDIKTVIFSTMNDSRVCSECHDLEGIEITIEDLVPYDNAPPVHNDCRCFLVAVI